MEGKIKEEERGEGACGGGGKGRRGEMRSGRRRRKEERKGREMSYLGWGRVGLA